MSRFLIKLFLVLGGLLSLASCDNWDKEDTYTFRYTLDYQMMEKEDIDPLEKYFEDRVDFKTPIQIFGTRTEAINKAQDDFLDFCGKTFTNEEVEALLPNEYDACAFNLVLVVGTGYTNLANVVWYHKDPSDGTEESSVTSE